MSTRQDLIHVSGGNLVMGSDGFYPEESPSMRVLIDDEEPTITRSSSNGPE